MNTINAEYDEIREKYEEAVRELEERKLER